MDKFFTKAKCKGRKRVKYDLVQRCLDAVRESLCPAEDADFTTLEELFLLTPDYFLIGEFVPEEEWDEWKDLYDLHKTGYPKDSPRANWNVPKGY